VSGQNPLFIAVFTRDVIVSCSVPDEISPFQDPFYIFSPLWQGFQTAFFPSAF
jgi:hypothetical protein